MSQTVRLAFAPSAHLTEIQMVTQGDTARAVFDRWLRFEMTPGLAARGWHRRGSVFSRVANGNTSFIEFRESRLATPLEYEFSIDLGLFSPYLAQVWAGFTGIHVPTQPQPTNAQLSLPLGWLMGRRSDFFWRIRTPESAVRTRSLGTRVRRTIETLAIPWLDAHSSDEQLRDYFLQTAVEQDELGLSYLRALLVDRGPVERVAEVDALLSTVGERMARLRQEAIARHG